MKNLHFCFSFILVIVASSFTTPNAHKNVMPVDTKAVALDYFVKIEGIKGNSQDSKHKEWIEVLSLKVMKARKTVIFTRNTSPDVSPLLRRFHTQRRLIKEVLIHGTDGTAYKLKDVYISSYHVSGASSTEDYESVYITYTGLE